MTFKSNEDVIKRCSSLISEIADEIKCSLDNKEYSSETIELVKQSIEIQIEDVLDSILDQAELIEHDDVNNQDSEIVVHALRRDSHNDSVWRQYWSNMGSGSRDRKIGEEKEIILGVKKDE